MGYLTDGHPTLITFSNAPTIKLKEKTVKPPGVDMGGPNDTTTFRNSVWRTQQPKKLKKGTAITFTAAYDPAVYDTIIAQAGVNQLVTVTFSNGDTLDVWGWIDKFEPGDSTEGAQPTASVTVEISNQDNSGNEIAPDYNAA